MTSGSQNISPEVNFRKSKIIIERRLLKIKKHYGSQLLYIKKNYIFYFILYFKTHIKNYKTYKF